MSIFMGKLRNLGYLALAASLSGGCMEPKFKEGYAGERLGSGVYRDKMDNVEPEPKVKPFSRTELIWHPNGIHNIEISPLYEGMPPRFFVSNRIPKLDEILDLGSDLYRDDRIYTDQPVYLGIFNAPRGDIEIEGINIVNKDGGKIYEHNTIEKFLNKKPYGITIIPMEPEGEGVHEIVVEFKNEGKIFARGGFYTSLAPEVTASK